MQEEITSGREGLKERFRQSLGKRPVEFLAVLYVSPEKGVQAVSATFELDEEDSREFVEILSEVIREEFTTRGEDITQAPMMAAGQMILDFLRNEVPKNFLPEEFLEGFLPEMAKTALEEMGESAPSEEQIAETVRRVKAGREA